jgi:glycosyltransferase involved in cell wall biosynthesis
MLDVERRAVTLNDSPAVVILLSTYNGAKFLRAQLDSILNQSHRNLVVRVRDDGSTDATPEILREYARAYPSLDVESGTNVGVVASYLHLLAQADGAGEFFAFADQDDVWLPTKIETAITAMRQRDQTRPLLYFSAVEYVDADLNHLGYSRAPRRLGFGNALVENVAVGATVVINEKARGTALTRMPQNALMHDWWFYLFTTALGEVIYDPTPSMKYRQHDANVIGWQHGFRHVVLQAFADVVRPYRVSPTFTDQARDFLACYAPALDRRHHDILMTFLTSHRNLWSRARFAVWMSVWRQSRFETLKLRAQVLTGRY